MVNYLTRVNQKYFVPDIFLKMAKFETKLSEFDINIGLHPCLWFKCFKNQKLETYNNEVVLTLIVMMYTWHNEEVLMTKAEDLIRKEEYGGKCSDLMKLI